jgi:coatomer subunit gamma
VFHDANFVKMHPRRCCQQIAKLLFFLSQGDTFSGPDAEVSWCRKLHFSYFSWYLLDRLFFFSQAVFFGVTKLFQSPDGNLRRMVYLFLKTVAETTDSSSLIIVTQSLVKDMFSDGPGPLYKGNSLRVLSSIVDASMLGQLERYYKQALVDKDEYVSSAALVSSLLLIQTKPGTLDVINRWVNEVQTVLSSTKGEMVQFHALALLRNIKRHDKLAVSKVVTTLMRSSMKSPIGLCLLVRFVYSLLSNLILENSNQTMQSAYFEFLESCLKQKSEMVMFEAAKAICSLPSVSTRDLSPAITVLHSFLASTKPALRFAAVKTLHKLALTHAMIVAKCNDDLETLISDGNRAVATLAITTLLKTGSEANVDRFMKQITTFMADVGSDELKIIVIQAIHELALRIHSKFRSIMTFLSSALREEGGFEYKKAILDGLLDIMDAIPEAKNEGLFHLCEFIEDCEFSSLASRVLHLLGDEGPSAPQPGAFIRFIYNRVILEASPVRASAVSALAKFATKCPDLQPSIVPLLQRCLDDDDDEVRDRATMFLKLLRAPLSESTSSNVVVETVTTPEIDPAVSSVLLSSKIPLPVSALAKALTLYQMRPSPGPFSFAALPHVEVSSAPGEGGYSYATEIRAVESAAKNRAAAAFSSSSSSSAAASSAASSSSGAASAIGGGAGAASGAGSRSESSSAAEALYKIPEFAKLGPLFKSSKNIQLTEDELEYLVSAQKHVFVNGYVVFQFSVRNTLSDVQLERVNVVMEPSEGDVDGWKHIVSIAAGKVTENAPGNCYVCFQHINSDEGVGSVTSFDLELRFLSREFDPSTEQASGDATKETFPLDSIEVSVADYVAAVPVPDFRAAWDAVGSANELLESYALPFKSVGDALSALLDTLGLVPCEGTGIVKAGATKHNAYLSGVFLGNKKVLARLQLTLDEENSVCVLKIGLRSEDEHIPALLMERIA